MKDNFIYYINRSMKKRGCIFAIALLAGASVNGTGALDYSDSPSWASEITIKPKIDITYRGNSEMVDSFRVDIPLGHELAYFQDVPENKNMTAEALLGELLVESPTTLGQFLANCFWLGLEHETSMSASGCYLAALSIPEGAEGAYAHLDLGGVGTICFKGAPNWLIKEVLVPRLNQVFRATSDQDDELPGLIFFHKQIPESSPEEGREMYVQELLTIILETASEGITGSTLISLDQVVGEYTAEQLGENAP